MWTLYFLLACGQSASLPTTAPEEAAAPPVEDPVPQGPITIESPRAGATLPSGEVQLRGSASVWEGMVSLQIRRGEEILAEGSAQASEAAPGRGPWQATLVLQASPGPAILEAFTRSPRDGSPQHKVEVAVVLD